MAPHQIVSRLHSDGRETASFGDLSVTHPTDALRRLLRQMVKRGLTGPAEVRNAAGRLSLTVRAIEVSARWCLVENDRGLYLRRHVDWSPPLPAQGAVKNDAATADAVMEPAFA